MAGADVSMELFGLSEFTAKLGQLRGQARDIAADEMHQGGKAILAASQNLVPVETETLKRSGFVDRPETHGDWIALEVGYGGDASGAGDYAVIQHEDLTLRHPRGGQAKFLEQPALEMFPAIERRIARRLGGELR